MVTSCVRKRVRSRARACVIVCPCVCARVCVCICATATERASGAVERLEEPGSIRRASLSWLLLVSRPRTRADGREDESSKKGGEGEKEKERGNEREHLEG